MPDQPPASDVAAAYDRWSQTYDSDPNRTRERAAALLRDLPLALAGREVLEIGCGTGFNTRFLAERAAAVVALDFSPGMLAKARERVSAAHVHFLEHDLRRPWPIEDSAADLIVTMLVLEHVEDLAPFFAQCARTLRPGGEVFLCELHPMRQLGGGQAQFTDRHTGVRERVTATLHDVADYVNGGLAAGLELIELAEPRDLGAARTEPPRLIALRLRRRKGL
ncbi:MAG TPA: class I SAM-dependent methyltransferase [Thermoanaerobaculia bacterium]|nr:class I SAM-dependent methyltransferase [Thermoanaerobaculia bacterium]